MITGITICTRPVKVGHARTPCEVRFQGQSGKLSFSGFDPQPTSLRCAAKWENEFYEVGIAPKVHGSPGENLMLFFGRSLPANN